MTLLMRLKTLVLVFILVILFLSKMARSYELHSYDDEYISLIINTSKLYGMKYIVFVYAQSIEGRKIYFYSLFVLFSFLYYFSFFRNGSDNNDIQMDSCTISRRFYHFELVLFRIKGIIVLHKNANCTPVLHSNYI